MLCLSPCVGPSYLSRTMSQVSLPPLPFLPVPMQLVCPSKVICEEQQEPEGGEEEEDGAEAEQAGGSARLRQEPAEAAVGAAAASGPS